MIPAELRRQGEIQAHAQRRRTARRLVKNVSAAAPPPDGVFE
jgi:hypothetical protein